MASKSAKKTLNAKSAEATSHQRVQPPKKTTCKKLRDQSTTKPAARKVVNKKQNSALRKMKCLPTAGPIPVEIQKNLHRKHSNNYSEKEKKRRQAKKLEYANKVGWMERRGRHRHAHQARREKQFINFMNGLPLDYDMSDSD